MPPVLGACMNADPIPIEVRRFVQSNALTVPHIEMIILVRREPTIAWGHGDMGRRLYVSEERAAELLAQLETLGVLERAETPLPTYYYRPATPDLATLLDRLDLVYSKHLLAVTKLVHAARDEGAEQFAKAFKFRKED